MRPCGAERLNRSVMHDDEVLSCTSSSTTCGACSTRLLLMCSALRHCGSSSSCSLSLAEHTARSMAPMPKVALAFARLSTNETADRSMDPVTPCRLAAFMQHWAHRQCAGDEEFGSISRSVRKPVTQSAVSATCSMRVSEIPPTPLYTHRTLSSSTESDT
eukprot:7391423-Prymnesium_polylepis.4